MAFLKRCLVVLFLQIGCLALDHSTGDLAYQEDELRVMVNPYPTDPVINSNSEREDEIDQSEQLSESSILTFHPKLFDFKDSPVGMPRLGLVRMDNRLKDENLKLISISGNTINFHSSFFADKVIGPGNHTTFEVVFLSREEGSFESTLYIHTSKGLFKYQVRGVGLPNPYRLRPLVGARIPVNASYEPLIMLHNPHETRILVVEMLSSGTDFSLKLPDEADEDQGDAAWAIEPFQTKPVMQGSFQGKTEGNHTGFIRIKVNHTAAGGEYLMVPVEVQVSSSPGIYSPQESLDFGLLVQSDKPRTLSLSLINAQMSPVNVQSVNVKGDPNPALRIEFRPLVIEPEISTSTVVALITFDPSEVTSMDQSNGFIEIRSDCGKSISIPYQVTVLQGELEYNISTLGFYIKSDDSPPRNFSVRNSFSTSVAIYQVSVNHPDIVQINQMNQSHVISPGEQKIIFTLKVQNKDELCSSKQEVQLTVKSNITCLKLPITCYNGKLDLHSSEEKQIDFGRVELYSSHAEYFSVENRNPVEIRLKSWGSNSSTWSQVELVGMQKGVKEDLAKIKDFDGLKKSLFLQPGYVAVFSIEVRRPTIEGVFYGESYVTTDHNQTLRVPFRFIVSKGSVQSETLLFDKVFPSKISYEKLYLSSTFNHTLNLLKVRANPASSIWFSSSSLQEYPEVSPHRRSFVGKVHLDPRNFCGQDCYAGFSVDSEIGKRWAKGALINWETGNIDMRILKTLQARFQDVKDATVSNISMWIDTSGLTGFKAKAQVKYVWPRLSSSRIVIFPLTALSNHSVMEIPLHNPSDLPVLIQAVMAKDYGPSWVQFIYGNNVGGNTSEGESVFKMNGVFTSSSSQSNGSVILDQTKKQTVANLLGLNSFSSLGLTFLLPAGAKFLLNVAFKPLSKDMVSTLVILRNNLTGIETVWLKGRAGTGQLTVGNGTPGSSLLFQLTEKLLQGCQTEQANKYVPPQLTVRRSFVARNVGEIPLDIRILKIYPPQGSIWAFALGSFSSPADPCEGYGFRILNCHPFKLQPNQTHSIDIAFTPDFTLSRVVRSLQLTDSTGSNFNYSLVALVPSGMLGVCASAITRPSWEPIFKYTVGFGVLVVIISAFMMSYFEAGNVVSKTVLTTIRVSPKDSENDGTKDEGTMTDKGIKLDLKAVYDKVENRFKRHQLEVQKQQNTSLSPQASSTCKQTPSQNGNTVATRNESSGNLRNRKTKKQDVLPLSSVNKQTDKFNQVRNGSVVDFMDDLSLSTTVGNSSISNLSGKKEKENVLGVQTKKKKNCSHHPVIQMPQIQTQSLNKTKKSVHDKTNKSKTEEETSSTTTEGSNSEDFMTSFPEKENKPSLKSGNEIKSPKSLKKDNQEHARHSGSGSSENISGSPELLASKNNSEDTRKKSGGKKKEYNGMNYGNFNNPSGNVSPKQEMWDTPRPSSGDGLSELAAQTEAFVMQKPQKRNNSGGDPLGNNLVPPSFGPNTHIYLAPTLNHHQMTNLVISQQHLQQLQQQNRPKKPGVIGQPRPNQIPPNQMPNMQPGNNVHYHQQTHPSVYTSLPSGLNSFVPISPMAPSSSSNNLITRHSPIMTRPVASSIWGPDILPDNGCDIWGRRTVDSGSNIPVGYYNNPGGIRPSQETLYGRGGAPGFVNTSTYQQQMQNGFGVVTSTSSGMRNDNQQFTQRSNLPPSGLPVNSMATHNNGKDDSYFSGGAIANELINNLWQINSGPPYTDAKQQFRSQASYTGPQTPSQYGMAPTGSTQNGQHGYLHRMGSDPTGRSQHQQRAKNWIPSTYGDSSGSNIRQNGAPTHSGEVVNNSDVNSLWQTPAVVSSASSTMPRSGSASIESSFAEWSTIARSTTRLAEPDAGIWEPGSTTSSNRWPSSYGSTTTIQNNLTDSMAVGSGARPNIQARQDDSSNVGTGALGEGGGIRTRSSDLREVEVGLGFNPFTSNIWANSDGPSWTSSNRQYSSNNE